ncbi:hypothetical protein MSZK_09080 [Mycobacterium sp. shizuoka-1]|nr:hypothetical protein MSZK_09080 [Mycobacterium sp. shizuoka-1]
MARGRRTYKRDAKGRFAKTASAAKSLVRKAQVGSVGPGGRFRGVSVAGTRTVKRRNVKVAVYGSATVGVRRIA